jgi:hypothetical protein
VLFTETLSSKHPGILLLGLHLPYRSHSRHSLRDCLPCARMFTFWRSQSREPLPLDRVFASSRSQSLESTKAFQVVTLEHYYSNCTCLTYHALGIRFAIACHMIGCLRFRFAKAANLVGVLRFELRTLALSRRCSNQLSYTPFPTLDQMI